MKVCLFGWGKIFHFQVTSTDHGVGDVALSVGVTAVLVRHNGDVDLRIKVISIFMSFALISIMLTTMMITMIMFTFWRTRARLPPSVVVPQPLTVQIVPSSYLISTMVRRTG